MPMYLEKLRSASKVVILVMGKRQLTESEKDSFERCLSCPSKTPIQYEYYPEPESAEEWLGVCRNGNGPDVAIVLPGYIPFTAQAMQLGYRHVIATPFGDYIEVSITRLPLPLTHAKKQMIVVSVLGGEDVKKSTRQALENCFHKGDSPTFAYIGINTANSKKVHWGKLGRLVEKKLVQVIILGEQDVQFAIESRTIFDTSIPHVTIDKSTGQVHQFALGRKNISK